MKYKFVLDENVFKHALNRVDKHEKPDDSAMNLLRDISNNCHRIILDNKLNGVFIQVLEDAQEKLKLRETKIDDKFIVALKKILVNRQKYLFQKYHAEGLEDSGIENMPRKDAFMAKLAIKEKTQAHYITYIVTSDEDFEIAVNNSEFLANQKIYSLNIKEALEKSKEK